MAKTAVFWLNASPVSGGVSQDLSPRTTLMGQQVDYKRHCRFQSGEYTQTHDEHNNSMNPRTVGALVLQPVGNGQGSFYFLSIATGRVLNRLHATALPMPDDVIDKLHRMARQQRNNPGLVFADRNLNPDEYDDDEDDEDNETYHDDDSTSDKEEDVLSYNEEENNDLGEDTEENDPAPTPPIAEVDDEQPETEAEADQPANENEDDEEADLPENQGVDEEVIDEHNDEADPPEIQGVDGEVVEPEAPEVETVEENEKGEEEDPPTEDEVAQPPQGNGKYNLRNN